MPRAATTKPLLRFAPSPNGYLHMGHAFSALLNEAVARDLGGEVLLRVENIDTTRCRPAFETAMYEDLAWLGLSYRTPVRRQSEHGGDYAQGLARVNGMGLLYPCRCSRKDIGRAVAALGVAATTDPDGSPVYPGTCRSLPHGGQSAAAQGEHALRLNMAAALARVETPLFASSFAPGELDARDLAVDPAAWGDVVLARKDIGTSYHLSVVMDDALQGVTHVVRGIDLAAATAIHRLLQELLGLDSPLYHHHDLIRDGEGAKLAKSMGSLPLRELRAQGTRPQEIRAALGFD